MNATPGNAEPAQPSLDIARTLADAQGAWEHGNRPRAFALLSALAERLPGDATVRGRLGAYALEAGRYDEALRSLEAALALDVGDAATWTNLGTARVRLGRAAEAVVAYRQALALDPGALAAQVNLGNALQQTGDVDGAVAALEAARALDPESHEILNNLGNLYKEQGRAEEALAAYEAARRAAPAFAPAFSNLLAATKLSAHHSPDEICALHRAFSAQFESDWRAGYVPLANTPDPGRRLRLGYVSPDCHTALPAFVEPVLRAHDRARFDVFAYFNNPQSQATLDRLGGVTARVMRGHADAAVAQWIRDDRIDVLLDIAGHTGHNRLGVFGRKPAPVQMTWLDYLNTTGLDAIDYRITDATSDPVGSSEAFASETLARLGPAQWCWNPPSDAIAPGPLPMLASGHPTFGSFNNGSKLTDETLALWARLLATIPTARLVVVGVAEGSAQARVRAVFGAAAARVRVTARVAPDAFRRETAAVDIALDPRPFSGATTTLEMLIQGVPVVTWPGTTPPSRSTASLLSALGLDGWIARDGDDYLAIVKRALADRDALATLRAGLPGRLRASPLCDAPAFARKLEALVVDAWKTWCARKTEPAGTVASPPSAAAALRTIDGDAQLLRIEASLRARNLDSAVAAACALVDERPEWQAAHRAYLQALLAWSRTEPDLVARTFPPPAAHAGRPRISVVICSIDPRKFERVTASYRQRFAGHALEIIGVHDARSLAEGYNRAATRATRRRPGVFARRHRARDARLRAAHARAPRPLRRHRRRRCLESRGTEMGAGRPAPCPWPRAARGAGRPHRRPADGGRFPGAGVREHSRHRRRFYRGASPRMGDAALRCRYVRRLPSLRSRLHVAGERRGRAARRAARPLAPSSLDGPLRCGMAALRRGGSSRARDSIRSLRPCPEACKRDSKHRSRSMCCGRRSCISVSAHRSRPSPYSGGSIPSIRSVDYLYS